MLVPTAGPQPAAAPRRAPDAPAAGPALPLAEWPATAGFIAAAAALLPLAGWGSAWPALAAMATGWQVVPIPVALALLLAGLGLALGHRRKRGRGALHASGWLGSCVLLIGMVELLRGPTPFRQIDGADVVERWPDAPELALRYGAALPEAAALALLGLALVLLVVPRLIAVRCAYLASLGAIIIALLAAGPPALDPVTAAAGELPRAGTYDIVIGPPVAVLVLLLGSGLLLVQREDRLWGLPVRAGGMAMTRLLLPGVLLLPPLLVWLVDLGVRRGTIGAADGQTLLAAGLVVALGLLMSSAALRAHLVADADRDREEKRLRREARREAETAALQAEQTARAAADRYRVHLRGILEVAPTPFVALDGSGRVAYANAAAGTLFGRPAEETFGLPLHEAWGELGEEVWSVLGSAVSGAPVERLLRHPRTGAGIELHGFPGEEGTVLFVREVGR